jgi:hypothetical protein
LNGKAICRLATHTDFVRKRIEENGDLTLDELSSARSVSLR